MDFVWSQKYRPEKISDLITTDELKTTLQSFISQKNLPNFLFHSSTGGTGKTTTAQVLASEMDMEHLKINASEQRGIDVVRNMLTGFASTVSMNGNRKMLILDEADNFTPDAQNALRGFIEKFSENCCFILTANSPNKIIQPIHSRCSVVEFKFQKADRPKIAANFYQRVRYILEQENVQYDPKLLQMVIIEHFPDFRRTINEVQRFSSSGVLSEAILSSKSSDVEVLIEALRERKFQNIRKFLSESWNGSEKDLYRELYEKMLPELEPNCIGNAILILSRYGYESTFPIDAEIHSIAAMVELMMLPLEFK